MSVIVPVRNRKFLLARLLDCLEGQTFDDFELVVIDDGSTDGCAAEALARRSRGLDVRVVHSGGEGAVLARRLGVEVSQGEILAFTDSDCFPLPGWLEAGVTAIASGADVVKGATHPERWPLAPFERSVGSFDELLYPTCNMFYRREVYETFGGFDVHAGERLGFRLGRRARGLGFGEDTLLAWRARRGGARVEYVEGATVRHFVFPPDIRESLSRTALMAAFPALLREVPELQPQLLRKGLLFGVRSRLPFYATLILLVTGRFRLSAMAIAWWVALRAAELRPASITRRRKLALLPAEMAMDVATGVSLAAGSLRARKLVL